MADIRFTFTMRVGQEYDLPDIDEVARLLWEVSRRLRANDPWFWDTVNPIALLDLNRQQVGVAEFTERDDGNE